MNLPIDRDTARELDQILRNRSVVPHFQPVVDLDTNEVVAYEALARCVGGRLGTPAELFGAARAAGRLKELDWLCRERAIEQARAASLRSPLSLFINAEPQALSESVDDADRWSAMADLRCYTEFTERSLAARPADLLRAVERVREQDWGIALDDIGAVEDSFALMPLLQPDVLKLDMALLIERADRSTIQVLHAVLAQAQDTGAAVVAEGIENERHLDTARAYGVQLGQGFHLGRPMPLPHDIDFPNSAIPLLPRIVDRTILPGPFAMVASKTRTRRLPHQAVVEIVRQLINQAQMLQPNPVLLVAVPHSLLLGVALRDAIGRMADKLPLVALIEPGAAADPLPGVRTSTLTADDPAAPDFDVVVVTPYYAAALVARPARTGPITERSEYDAVLTFDRPLVISAANTLLRRLDAEPAGLAAHVAVV